VNKRGWIEDRQGHRDSVGMKPLDPVGDYETPPLTERLPSREEGGGMPVQPHPKEYEIEAWKFFGLQMEKGSQYLLIFLYFFGRST
jgi:hypothetical protein